MSFRREFDSRHLQKIFIFYHPVIMNEHLASEDYLEAKQILQSLIEDPKQNDAITKRELFESLNNNI